ncbi:MAG TPA: hypothetical protein VFZ61_18705 [Polyangiales bacterium]
MVRPYSSIVAVCLLFGCSDSHSASAPNLCERAHELREAALAAAQRDAPACATSADCVVLSLVVECSSLLRRGDCGRAVHRDVASRYQAMAVNQSICQELADAEMGCFGGPICAAVGPVECVAGQCTQPEL